MAEQKFREKRTWVQSNLDYKELYEKLLLLHTKKRKETRAYTSVLLFQLKNGLKLLEAIRAFKTWVSTGYDEFQVPLAKRRKHPDMREVFVPRILQKEKETREEYSWVINIDDKVLANRIKAFCKNYLKINSTSIKYAFIKELLKKIDAASVRSILKYQDLKKLINFEERVKEEGKGE
jgi:hypothetical protein